MGGPSRHAGDARGGHDDHVRDGRERRKERESVDNRREGGERAGMAWVERKRGW